MELTAEPLGTVETALRHGASLLRVSPARAAEQAGEILRERPGHARARMLLAEAQLRQGESEAAVATLRLLVADADAPRARLALSAALWTAGRRDEARAVLAEGVARFPGEAALHRRLGDVCAELGDEAAADWAYLGSVRASVGDAVLVRAATALRERRPAEAEAALRERVDREPTDVAALRMLAELAYQLGAVEDARALLERALELCPSFDAARYNYALVLQRQDREAEALPHVERLLAAEPEEPRYLLLKAAILVRLGDYGRAVGLYEALTARQPDFALGWTSLGHARKTLGDAAGTVAAYRQALAAAPLLGEAWWSLANLKTFRFAEPDVAAMRRALGRGDLRDEDRLQIHFALGKALEDAGGEDEAAFGHYAQGNRLRRQQLTYSADETTRRCRRFAAAWDRGFFAARAGAGAPETGPIFVLGLPRSGSTLVEQILASHSQVEGTMELPDMLAIGRRLEARGGWEQLSPRDWRALGEEYLARTAPQRREGKPFFIDKMPNNWIYAGFIHLMLPGARIIDVRRDPMACGWANFTQHFARGQDFTYDLGELGRYWRDYAALMAHVDAVLPGRVHRVQYETLVTGTEASVRALLDYCGLDFEPACLAFHASRRPVRTASAEQVRQPIFLTGLDRWRRFDAWLGPLKAALAEGA